jgi:hypothetical protein
MKKMPWHGVTVVAVSTLLLSGGGSAGAREATDEQPSLVEDYNYPGAAQIIAEHGLKLFKGDGHILFVTSRTYDEGQCATGQLQVEKALDVEPYGVFYCFQTVGAEGFLTLEVPATFGIRGGNAPIEATAELPTGDQTYDVPPNGFVAISPGPGGEPPAAILVELRMTGAAG